MKTKVPELVEGPFLLVDYKSIGDGAVLFLGSIRIGSKGRAFGCLDGFLSHRVVENLGAFCGDFGANDLTGTIDPNVHHNLAFFTEVIIGTMQRFCSTATEVITCSVAFSAIAIIVFDARQTIGLALVARLT